MFKDLQWMPETGSGTEPLYVLCFFLYYITPTINVMYKLGPIKRLIATITKIEQL